MVNEQRRRGRPTLARSVRLFRLFLSEQSDPDSFYTALAADSVDQISRYVNLSGATLLDVGGGPGYFGRAFHQAGARYIGLELDVPSDLPVQVTAVRGSGEAIPVATSSVDVAYCSNVVEHVRRPWTMADELVRVTASGGIVYLSFTPWFSPWGGHETAPWHLLGGHYARRRFTARAGRPPKNAYGDTLFGYRVAEALQWARSRPDVEFVAVLPRYHPRWAWWVVRVPILREFAVWNIVLVLRKR
ncbi:MAG TPA: class I SAM-dependent methyltransferase [Jatrophihabitans sp.]|nr:class I SAM-dependent methyltransferase [Jatrophihabitans sp.]